uniref:Solute carrier family 22 member 16 n=1 Tax=Rousettus aegyptiacus TaxID=9407 RepID=A0A7J8KGU7_ROUAE|nr:solute carrier family 22 member 16 [Rousettus aegyptiacus]
MGLESLEVIFDRVGHFGRFQVFLYFTCAIQNTACGMHYLAAVFLTLHPKHTCRPPGNVSQIVFHNTSVWKLDDIWTQFSIGRGDYIVVQLYDGDVWELTGCYRYRRENKSSLNYDYDGLKSSSPCVDGFIYDRSKWDNTVVTQWNLVCNREWFASLIQPTFMFGVLLGALAFGYLSDRVGRRLVMWSTSIGMYFFGIAVAFTFDFYSFIITRFLLAVVSSGYLVVVFVYVTEFIGMKARTWASIHLHSFFAIGTMVVALTGYLVRTWWTYQMILSTASLPFVFGCWLLPETPFWLVSEGRYEEAQLILDKVARWNRASTCKLTEILSLDLHDPIAFKPSAGAVEIPAYIFVCLGMDIFGRRNILVFSLLSSAFFSGMVMVIPRDRYIWTVVATMAGKFGIGSAFGLIFLYTAELYPTMIRTQAVGSGSMVSRGGSILAPFSIYLSSIWIFMPQMW